MKRANDRGGLTIENEGSAPINVIVGSYVYITQQGDSDQSVVILERGPAQQLADAITLALASSPSVGEKK